jgi:hypothetical protein
MSAFFDDVKAFRAKLQQRETTGGGCWSCQRPVGPLVDFHLHKDFTSLGVPLPGCSPSVTLCFECGARYMNSFNRSLDRKLGR